MIRYLVVPLLALLSFPVAAAVQVFEAQLSGLVEDPVNNSPGTGFTRVSLDVIAHTLRVEITFSGLSGITTAAHIHCCQNSPGQPSSVGVATELPSFTGFPLGVQSGSYDHTFDTSLDATFNPAFEASHGGTAAGAEAGLGAGLAAGLSYLNIHTSAAFIGGPAFPGGEIRGFPTPVPEPATYGLLGLGLAALGLILRERRKTR